MPPPRSRSRHSIANAPTAADPLPLLLGRAYLNYTAVLQSFLAETGLDRHFRPGMGPVLFALFDGDGVTLTELVARTSLAPSSVTEIIKRMERGRLVRRKRDIKDGRAVRVYLTAHARKFEDRCRAVDRRICAVMETGLSHADSAKLRKLLASVVMNLHGHFKPETTCGSSPRAENRKDKTAGPRLENTQ